MSLLVGGKMNRVDGIEGLILTFNIRLLIDCSHLRIYHIIYIITSNS